MVLVCFIACWLERLCGTLVKSLLSSLQTPKRWEKPAQKANGMPIRHKLHVKIGDTVRLISGHDKGKVSEITEIDYIRQMVLCKDVNIKTKHKKPRAKGESGQIVQVCCQPFR